MNLLTARFALRADAEHALARLRELGLAADGIRIAEQPARGRTDSDRPSARGDCLLHARALDADTGRVADVLRESNAMHVHQRQEPDDWSLQRWMGLQNGRQTGTGVAPGLGDAEAGMSTPAGADTTVAGRGTQSAGSKA